MKKHRTIITELAFGGDGVGRIDGKVCFVRGALPGEEVVFNVEKETASYIKGIVSEISSASKERITPRCKYYEACGGCCYQHLDYKKELFYKQQQVNGLLRRFGGIDNIETEIVPSEQDYNYRTTVTLNRGKDGYGFCAYHSNDVVCIDECVVTQGPINNVINGLKGKDKRITLKADWQGRIWRSDDKRDKVFKDKYLSREIFFSAGAFSQGNRLIAEKIALQLNEWLGNDNKETAFFDVFCGVGLFSFLTPDFKIKSGMDNAPEAVECAKKTAAESAKGCFKFYCGDVTKKFAGMFKKFKAVKNVLFLDPPRQGLNRSFAVWLSSLTEVDAIFYLSCQPAVMARDLKLLLNEERWRLSQFKIFDMFARTAHLECLAEIRKR